MLTGRQTNTNTVITVLCSTIGCGITYTKLKHRNWMDHVLQLQAGQTAQWSHTRPSCGVGVMFNEGDCCQFLAEFFQHYDARQQCDVTRTATHTCDVTILRVKWNNIARTHRHTHTHTRLTALFPGLPRWASTRKVKTNLDFTEARDSEWQWHQLGHMQVCTSLQTDNHASTSPLSFYRPDALPVAQPTASKHWRTKKNSAIHVISLYVMDCS